MLSRLSSIITEDCRQRNHPKTKTPQRVISWPGFSSHSLVRPAPFFSATCSIVFLTSKREALSLNWWKMKSTMPTFERALLSKMACLISFRSSGLTSLPGVEVEPAAPPKAAKAFVGGGGGALASLSALIAFGVLLLATLLGSGSQYLVEKGSMSHSWLRPSEERVSSRTLISTQ